jgi:quercetin dioxygenase-like cupin family protein
MKRMAMAPALALVAGIVLCVTTGRVVDAQQQSIKRTDILTADLAGMEDKQMHIWNADIAPGAATGRHHHPTPRFVVVLEGSVVLEVDGEPPLTFKAGEAFQELPDVVHNFRNASATLPAKALGIQYAGHGQPLQVDVH